MLKKFLSGIAMLLVAIALKAQGSTEPCGDQMTDTRDNQSYKSVLIGNQCWMAENLNVGTMVPDFNQTNNDVIEKTCYNNDPGLCEIYGGLYTWDEAMRGVCPDGWRVPSNQEWTKLNEYLGIVGSGTQLKAGSDRDPAWDGDNSSGFSAIPSGVGHEKYFARQGHWAVYWTSTEAGDDYAWFAQLDNHWYLDRYTILYQGDHFLKKNGFSVRCLRNEP